MISAGVPQVYYFGQEGLHNILVIDLLGPNLEDLFDMCGRKFTIKTVCMAAKQMVISYSCLLYIIRGNGGPVIPAFRHGLHWLWHVQRSTCCHNTKLYFSIGHSCPGNSRKVFNLPRYQTRQLFDWCFREQELKYNSHYRFVPFVSTSPTFSSMYFVDFGMAKHYRDPKTKVHIPYRERKSLSGTARYMSINTHLGREQSRRDDLESLGHVFMYFLRGGLPWQGLRAATNKQKYEKIGEKKQTTPISELCEGFPGRYSWCSYWVPLDNSFSEEFTIYMNYVRKLGFEETPDYDFLRELFTKVLKTMGEAEDGIFDWMLLHGGKGWESGNVCISS